MSTNVDRIINQDANAAVRDSLIPRQTVVSQAVCLSSPQVAFSLFFFLLLTGTFNSTISAMSFCTPAFAKAFKSIAINCFERLSFPIWARITHTPQAWTRGKAAPCERCELFPSAQLSIVLLPTIVFSTRTYSFALMAQPCVVASSSSSSNFQVVINNALKDYEKRTKKSLLTHPLASQLQACDSPGDILALLRRQILDQSRSTDERWTKWLDPTINVLLTFSQTVGTVGLV